MGQEWLIIETSGRKGTVALARNEAIVEEVLLDETRRHARDLASNVNALLLRQQTTPQALAGIMVSVGPGSYTGLRVGLVTAKVMAYAANVPVVAVPTFQAIAEGIQTVNTVAIVADALKGKAYLQEFARINGEWEIRSELRIVTMADYVKTETPIPIAGPGLLAFGEVIPKDWPQMPEELNHAKSHGMYKAGRKIPSCTREGLFKLEPLYLRGSSAEEQKAKG